MPEKYVKITWVDETRELDNVWLGQLLSMVFDEACLVSDLDNRDITILSKKDVEYTTWHRTLGSEFYATDIDLVEVNKKGLEPIAILEVKVGFGAMKEWQEIVLNKLAEKTEVPIYIVVRNREMTSFWVTDIRTGESLPEQTLEQHGEWIKSLRS